MGIADIGRFLKNIGATNTYDLINQVTKRTLNRVSGRTRAIFSGKELEELGLQHGLGNLNHPKLVLAGNNTRKGQSVWSAAVCDVSGKPVSVMTMGYDTTRGENPIFQLRQIAFDGKKKTMSMSEYIDTNVQIAEKPIAECTLTRKNGVADFSTELENAYRFNLRTVSPKKAEEFYEKTGFRIFDTDNIKYGLEDFKSGERAKYRIDFIKDTFKAKTPYAARKLEQIKKMDLKALAKETEVQQARLEKQEQELAKLYEKVFGTGEKTPNWREEFIEGKYTKINPVTNKLLPAHTIKQIEQKMKQYAETRNLLVNITEQKMVKEGFVDFDGRYITRMLNETGTQIGKTTDKIMVEELKALKGLPKEELITKAKDIICKRLNLPADLIEIKPQIKGLQPYTACFEETQACLYYHPSLLNVPDEMLIPLIRHELDHCEVISKIVKSMGLEEYKAFVSKTKSPEVISKYKDEVWAKVIERIDADGFNPEPYKKALEEYVLPWGGMKDLVKYFTNPLEARAYQAGFDMEVALNGGGASTLTAFQLINSKLCIQLQGIFDKMQKTLGSGFNLGKYCNNLRIKAANSLPNPATKNIETEVFEYALKIAKKDLQKALNGTFEDSSFLKCDKIISSEIKKAKIIDPKIKKMFSKVIKKSSMKLPENVKDKIKA